MTQTKELKELEKIKMSLEKFENTYFLKIYKEQKVSSELFELMWIGEVPKKIIKGLNEPFKKPCEVQIELGYCARHTKVKD